MPAEPSPALVEDAIALVRQVCPVRAARIGPDTALLLELDMDSLQTLELIEALKNRFEVDFMKEPLSVRDLTSPRAIARAIESSQVGNGREAQGRH